jgi:hypothetical protein
MFWKKKAEKDPTQIEGIDYPKVGERWIRKARDGNPWGDTDALFVEVFDVKDNWVRFGRKNGDRHDDDKHLKVEHFFMFHQRYIPLPEESQ